MGKDCNSSHYSNIRTSFQNWISKELIISWLFLNCMSTKLDFSYHALLQHLYNSHTLPISKLFITFNFLTKLFITFFFLFSDYFSLPVFRNYVPLPRKHTVLLLQVQYQLSFSLSLFVLFQVFSKTDQCLVLCRNVCIFVFLHAHSDI